MILRSATISGNSQRVLSIAENDILVEDSETVVSIAEIGTSLHNPPTAATTTSTLIEGKKIYLIFDTIGSLKKLK